MIGRKKILSTIIFLLSCCPGHVSAVQQNSGADDAAAFTQMFPEGELSEEDVYRADRLLLTATGSLKPVHLAPSVASVITSEDIEKVGATTLLEALEGVPGLHIGTSPLNVMEPLYSMRGIQTKLTPQILILLNGMPITMAYQGTQISTFKMPVNMISRIEVVRGPGSAVHGADAFSGVINIFTKDGYELDGSRAGVRYGSFDTVNTWLQHGGDYQGWNLALSLDYQKSQGDNKRIIATDLQSTLDTSMGTSASLAPGEIQSNYEIIDSHLALIKDNWTARLWGWFSNDAGVGDGVTNTLSSGSSIDAHQYMADLLYSNKDLLADWQFDLRLNYFAYEVDSFLQLFPAGSVLSIAADGNIASTTNPATGSAQFIDGVYGNPLQIGSQGSTEFTSLYEGLPQQKIRFSVGYRYQHERYEEWKNFGPGVLDNYSGVSVVDGSLTSLNGTNAIYMPNTRRDLWYVSLQDEWALQRNWTLTGGVRYDHYSDFGDTVNPRLALVWETRYDLTSKFMYGRAFRAPSFNELYIQNNPANQGNADLEPETIDTYELAFAYQPTSRLRTNLNFFYYETKDLINQVAQGTKVQSVNAYDTRGYGYELEADWQLSKNIQIKGNLARQRSKNQDSKELVADAPGWQFYANAHWDFLENWSLDGQYIWIGDRHRADSDHRDEIGDYDLVNLTLRRQKIANHWTAALAVRNLFNEDAREPAPVTIINDYPLPGRAVWAELRLHY